MIREISPANFDATSETHEALRRFVAARPFYRQLQAAPTLIARHWVDFKVPAAPALCNDRGCLDDAVVVMCAEMAAALLADAALSQSGEWTLTSTEVEHQPPLWGSSEGLRVSAALEEKEAAWSADGEKKVLVVITGVETEVLRAAAYVRVEVS